MLMNVIYFDYFFTNVILHVLTGQLTSVNCYSFRGTASATIKRWQSRSYAQTGGYQQFNSNNGEYVVILTCQNIS